MKRIGLHGKFGALATTTLSLWSVSAVGAQAECDLERGKILFNKCAICHSVEENAQPTVGPNLFGVVNRPVGRFEDFFYSNAIKAYADSWTKDTLDQFLKSPMTEVPGTDMAFAGFKKPADRKNLICYLAQFTGKL
ncbi:MAG: cytochrome c family protein [Lysobacterales bacterium]